MLKQDLLVTEKGGFRSGTSFSYNNGSYMIYAQKDDFNINFLGSIESYSTTCTYGIYGTGNITFGKFSGNILLDSIRPEAYCHSDAINGKKIAFSEFSGNIYVKTLMNGAYGIVAQSLEIDSFTGSITIADGGWGAAVSAQEGISVSSFSGIVISTLGSAFQSSAQIIFDDFSGTVVCNGQSSAYAVYATDGITASISGAIYGGTYSETGKSYEQSSASILNALNERNLSNSMKEKIGRAIVTSGKDNDFIDLRAGALIAGSLMLDKGYDEVSISTGAQMYGTITSTESLKLNFNVDRYTSASVISTQKKGFGSLFSMTTERNINMIRPQTGQIILIESDSALKFQNVSFSFNYRNQSCRIIVNGNAVKVGDVEARLYSYMNYLYLQTKYTGITDSVSFDIDGNGISDVIMTHDAGYTGAWLIQDTKTASWGNLSNLDGSWQIFGTEDSCIYLYDKVNNNVGAWLIGQGGNVSGWKTIGNFDSTTEVLGLGDFDGNGTADLLLRNINGAVGTHLTSGKGWNYFQSLGNEWSIAGIGDLNGDGIDDIVLQHEVGFSGTWLVKENGTVSWADLDTLDTGFRIAGTGDFNGDGVDDVLLQKGNYYGAWIVKDGSVSSWMGLGTAEDGNVLEQIGDFNGDGVDDLRVRTAAGDLGALCVMGTDKLEWNYYGSVGSEWNTSLAAKV